jgi:peptidoglycan/LPS O-acetylase OafA/YrhL
VRNRLDGIDLLRGLAIFFVLMNHINIRLPVLEGQVTLTDVLRAKRIRLAEEGTLLYRVQKR